MELSNFFAEIGLFTAKTLIIVFFISFIAILIALLASKAQEKSNLKVEDLKEKFDSYKKSLQHLILEKEDLKKLRKAVKLEEKKNKDLPPKPNVYVLDFEGDIKAKAVENLREEITAILTLATPQDQVVLKVESPGGVVNGYGLAASQVNRLREKNIPTTICVDQVAASGGYLMSVPATKIYAAPFAIIGSIGVVAGLPNFHRILKKYDVDYKEYTAGEFKRTVSLLGEITDKGEKKFLEQLEETHVLFKSFVKKYRPTLDLSKVATGEYWYGEQALELGLIDGLKTSDDLLLDLSHTHHVIKVSYEEKQGWNEKLSGVLGRSLSQGILRVLESLESRRFF